MEIGQYILEQRVKRYGLEHCLVPEKPFSDMSIEELRDYASALHMSSYNEMVYKNIPSEDRKRYVEQVNQEFSNRLEAKGLLEIYNWLDKNNDGKWSGEIRYQVLVRDCKPYEETTQVLKAVKIKTFLDTYHVPFSVFVSLYDDVRRTRYFGQHDLKDNRTSKEEQEINDFLSSL
jgi:hypothetical protein